MADPNQTPHRGDWKCPCNGCKKAAKQVIDQIVEDYKSCLNIVEVDKHLYCTTYWKHDDCERLRELLFKITNDFKYTVPEMRSEVKDALNQILKDTNTAEILKRLKDNG
jgi:hypothetical protein